MTDPRLAHYSRAFHPVVIVLGPFLFLQAVVIVLIGGALSALGVAAFPPLLGVIVLLAGITELVLGETLARERVSGIAPRLRELIVVLAVSMSLILVARGDLPGSVDLGRLEPWAALAVVAAQWILSHTIHRRLSARTAAHALLANVPDHSIPDRYAQINHEAGEALDALERTRRMLTGLLVAGAVVSVLVMWAGGFRLERVELAWSVAFFVGTSALALELNRHAAIDRSLASGHVVPPRELRAASTSLLVFAAACALLAIPLAGGRALLPESHLGDAVGWLRTLGPPRRMIDRVERPDLELRERGGVAPFAALGEMRALMADAPDRPDRSGIVMWTAVGLGLAGLVWFIVAPFVTGRASPRSVVRALVRAARAAIAAAGSAAAAMRRLASTMRRRRSRAAVPGDRPTVDGTARRGAGGAKPGAVLDRREQRGVLRSFYRLVRWARHHGVEFSPTQGAGEFAARLASVVPQRAADVIRLAALFEEIVFSAHENKSGQARSYHDLVAALHRTR